MSERSDLTKDEKLSVLESAIDRTKINRNSKFNQAFKEPLDFMIDGYFGDIVISAELYTRKEAEDILYEYRKEERLGCDYDNDKDIKEDVDTRNIIIQFGYVKMGYVEDLGRRVWTQNDPIRLENIHNFHKPVYYLDLG